VPASVNAGVPCCGNYFQQSRLLRTKLPLRTCVFDRALKAFPKKLIQSLDRDLRLICEMQLRRFRTASVL